MSLPAGHCQDSGSPQRAPCWWLRHFKMQGSSLSQDRRGLYYRNESLRPIHYSHEGKHFFLQIRRLHNLETWFVWLYIADSAQVANTFTVNFTVHNDNWNESRAFGGRPVSLDTPFPEIRDSRNLLEMSDMLAFRIWDENRQDYLVFNINLVIRRKNPGPAQPGSSNPTPNPPAVTAGHWKCLTTQRSKYSVMYTVHC